MWLDKDLMALYVTSLACTIASIYLVATKTYD